MHFISRISKVFLRHLLIFLVILNIDKVSAQKALNVEYSINPLNEDAPGIMEVNGFPFSYPAKVNMRMLENDTYCFIHFYNQFLDPIDYEKKSFAGNITHYGFFFDFLDQSYITQLSLTGEKEFWLPIDTNAFSKPIFMKAEKKILGFSCSPALLINERNDSILVWFTDELKYKKGFLFYFDVPGVILEVFDQRGKGVHLIALNVREMNIALLKPKKGIAITKQKFNTKLDSLR